MFITGALLAVSLQAEPNVADTVGKLKANRRIEVVLNTGEKLDGRRGAVFSDHFMLEPDHSGTAAREVNYAEVRTVKTKLSTGAKWAIWGGVVWVALIIIGSRT
jgi:hypothetical protein